MGENDFIIQLVAKLNNQLTKKSINNDLKSLNNTMFVRVVAKLSKTISRRELNKQLKELNNLTVNVGTNVKVGKDTKEKIQKNIKNIREKAPGKKLGGAEDIGNCPKCGKPIMEGKKNWYCPGYSSPTPCNFTIWKEIAGKKIPPEEVKKLLTNGRTKLIKGFHSSKGNSFDAYLILKEDKTIGFSFPEKKKTRKNLK